MQPAGPYCILSPSETPPGSASVSKSLRTRWPRPPCRLGGPLSQLQHLRLCFLTLEQSGVLGLPDTCPVWGERSQLLVSCLSEGPNLRWSRFRTHNPPSQGLSCHPVLPSTENNHFFFFKLFLPKETSSPNASAVLQTPGSNCGFTTSSPLATVSE